MGQQRRVGTFLLASLAFFLQAGSISAEMLTDRCSGKVKIPHIVNGESKNVILTRNSQGKTAWTETLKVKVNTADCCTAKGKKSHSINSDCGKFAWFCQPPGENHWYDEQSRCNNDDTRIQAKLGPDREVNFSCEGASGTPTCSNEGGGNEGGSGGSGAGSVGGPCKDHDFCNEGSTCNTSTNKCEKVEGDGCGGLGKDCCPPTSADPIGCGSTGQCSGGICQPCSAKDQLCCGGANISEGGCAPGLKCDGGGHCSDTGTSQDAIKMQDQPDHYAAAAMGSLVNVIEPEGNRFRRIYSSSAGQQWYFDATVTSEGLLAGNNVIGEGEFTSGPAAAVSSDGKKLHVFGRGKDNKIWRAYSTDGGRAWPVAWEVIGEGVFTSGPAAAVAADGQKLHVFARGNDNRIWRAYSSNAGTSWSVAWSPVGDGTFTSAPAATISADGKKLYVFGRGSDNRIWRAYSPDGGKVWTLVWSPIGEGTFTSAPAAVVSANGQKLHVFARGTDNKIWRAYSPDGGKSWPVAWKAIGDGLFQSGPLAAMSADGQKIHVIGRGIEKSSGGFSVPRLWRASSMNGGTTWSAPWSLIDAKGKEPAKTILHVPAMQKKVIQQ